MQKLQSTYQTDVDPCLGAGGILLRQEAKCPIESARCGSLTHDAGGQRCGVTWRAFVRFAVALREALVRSSPDDSCLDRSAEERRLAPLLFRQVGVEGHCDVADQESAEGPDTEIAFVQDLQEAIRLEWR